MVRDEAVEAREQREGPLSLPLMMLGVRQPDALVVSQVEGVAVAEQ